MSVLLNAKNEQIGVSLAEHSIYGIARGSKG
jgi:hypothetical protein